MIRSFSKGVAVVATASVAGYAYTQAATADASPAASGTPGSRFKYFMPKPGPSLSREEQVDRLKNSTFDVLVIGGGATGTGIAIDSASRGLHTALVEAGDFSSGTSSRSTKLLHGGVRYLEQGFKNLDFSQFKLVHEALGERNHLLHTAPHLSHPLPIMLPLYKWYMVPYFWAGLKVYDLFAGTGNLAMSRFFTRSQAMEAFPSIDEEDLVGAVVYYDGQHNDSRMNVILAMTAAEQGAAITNHTKVVGLNKDPDTGKVIGARVMDVISGEEFDVAAKCVVNATGPFADGIRAMDNEAAATTAAMVQGAAGTHLVLPGHYSPDAMGLLDPSTSDGRVLFLLPWLNHTVVGTTDRACPISEEPTATGEEIDFILKEASRYLAKDITLTRDDVLASWSGIRPLASNPDAKDTKAISRDHVITTSDSGLVTICGGKWTTYRYMAEDLVNKVCESDNEYGLKPRNDCSTKGLYLAGGENWDHAFPVRLVQEFGLPIDVAKHLSETYGDRAPGVARISAEYNAKKAVSWMEVERAAHTSGAAHTAAESEFRVRRLRPGFPYLEAEVEFACKEYARTISDVLLRRTRLAFLSYADAVAAVPIVGIIMQEELGWTSQERVSQELRAVAELAAFDPFNPSETGDNNDRHPGAVAEVVAVAE